MDFRRGPLLVFGSVAAAGMLLIAVAQARALEKPCPTGDRSVPPSLVHLEPTLMHHQNWVGLPANELGDRSTWVYACTDGIVVGSIKGHGVAIDPTSDTAQLKIHTRWVDLAWLTGDLDVYRDPGRWQLVYSSP